MTDDLPQSRIPDRIHLHVGPLCNNDCIFCLEDDRELRFIVNAAMTEERTREILELHQGTPEVVFTSGEPTLLEDLPALGRMAQNLGYSRVGLMTNGRRLGAPGYARDLVEAGFNSFRVGIHAPDAELHDRLVGKSGAFAQTYEGLRELAAIVGPEDEIQTSTVIVQANLGRLDALYRMLADLGVSVVRLDGLAARGRAHLAVPELFPRYSEVVAMIRTLLAGGLREGTRLELGNLPACTTVDLDPGLLGQSPEYASFEVEDGAPSPLARTCGTKTPDGRFRILDGERIESAGRIKGDPCAGCRYDAGCSGIYEAYISRHGWGEFDPVPPLTELH